MSDQKMKKWNPPSRDELRPLVLSELSSWTIAPGDIFITTPAGKVLRLKRTGDLLESQWVDRFVNSKRLSWIPMVNADRVELITKHFKNWQSEGDPQVKADKFEFLEQALRRGMRSGGMGLIDLACVGFSIFEPPRALVEEFQRQHVVLYRRALAISSLAVLLALASGYQDEKFLADVYYAAWFLDAGLADERFSHWVAEACQHERLHPGQGKTFLQNCGVADHELALFLEHPKRSFERARAEWKFNYPEALSAILRHHEVSDGTGFPAGIAQSTLSDWEALLILADSIVDNREEFLEKQLQFGWQENWKHYSRNLQKSLPVAHTIRLVEAWFAAIDPEEEVA